MENSKTKFNLDGQPINQNYNRNINISKEASVLKGILSGIYSDKNLNETELYYLQVWLSNVSNKKGDLFDLYYEIEKILSDGKITEEEKLSLMELIEDCINYSEIITDEKGRINQIFGFIQGITSDGKINIDEFESLIAKLDQDSDLLSIWPYKNIVDAIRRTAKSNKPTENELHELKEILESISGSTFTKDGDAIGGATYLFDDDLGNPKSGETICFTGKFLTGTRDYLEETASNLKLKVIKKNIIKDLNYLIIGTLPSRDWIHHQSGTKIRDALKFRETGSNIIISNERKWTLFLQESTNLG